MLPHSTDITLLLSSMKLCFILSIAEIHRLSAARILVVRAIASRLKVELSVQRDVHSFFESLRMNTENFRPGDFSTESFHKDGHFDLLCQRI